MLRLVSCWIKLLGPGWRCDDSVMTTRYGMEVFQWYTKDVYVPYKSSINIFICVNRYIIICGFTIYLFVHSLMYLPDLYIYCRYKYLSTYLATYLSIILYSIYLHHTSILNIAPSNGFPNLEKDHGMLQPFQEGIAHHENTTVVVTKVINIMYN